MPGLSQPEPSAIEPLTEPRCGLATASEPQTPSPQRDTAWIQIGSNPIPREPVPQPSADECDPVAREPELLERLAELERDVHAERDAAERRMREKDDALDELAAARTRIKHLERELADARDSEQERLIARILDGGLSPHELHHALDELAAHREKRRGKP